MFFTNSLFITYKGKVLLSTRDLYVESNIKNVWSFVGEGKLKGNPIKDSIYREIKQATKLILKNLESIELLHNNKPKLLYHAKLTDDNVNSIVRREGERLEFYDINELDNLSLSEATSLLLSENRQKLSSLLSD